MLVGLILTGCALITGNRPPLAIIEAGPLRGPAPLNVNFDGSLSSDPDGRIVEFRWSFGDGTSGQGPLVSHTYQRDGVYLVTLTVYDESGAKDEDKVRVIAGNPPPQAVFTTTTTSGWSPLTVSFDGSPSFDPEGDRIARYDWDFGDGNQATGVQTAHTYSAPGQYNARLTITDFNGNSSSAAVSIQVLGLKSARDLRVGNAPTAILADDFDGDGNLDLVVANSESDDLSIFYGQPGDLLFSSGMRITAGKRPVSLASGDFDGDGRLDLAVASFKSGDLSLLFNEGSRRFAKEEQITIGRWISSVIASDFDRDGLVDLAATDAGNDKILILLGDGKGDFIQQEPILVGDAPEGIASGDFDEDGRPDLAVTNFFDHTVQILLGNGVGEFRAASLIRVGQGPTSIKAVSFNDDKHLDLVVTNTSGATVSILIGVSGGRFSQSHTIASGRGVRAAEIADFDGDGSMDLVTASPGADSLSVLLNDGFDQFSLSRAKEFQEPDGPEALWIADFDRDGFPDIAVAHFEGNRVSILINQL